MGQRRPATTAPLPAGIVDDPVLGEQVVVLDNGASEGLLLLEYQPGQYRRAVVVHSRTSPLLVSRLGAILVGR